MKMNTKTLVELLADIAKRVEAGDSFEGSLSYTCMQEHLGPNEWEVQASYRIGNTEGQGGMRIIKGVA
jgi:hypothetical protein